MAGLQSERDDTDAFMAGRLTGGLRRLPLLASGGQAGQALRALAGARPQTLAALAAAAPPNPEETMGLPPRAPSAVPASDAYPRQSIRDLLGAREPAGFDIFLPPDLSPAPPGRAAPRIGSTLPAIEARSGRRIDSLLDPGGAANFGRVFGADGLRGTDGSPWRAPRTDSDPPAGYAAGLLRRLDRSPAAKAVGGGVALAAGVVPGMVRGAVHTAEGLADAARFAQRLQNPLDILISAPGESAWEQVFDTAGNVASYVQRGVADPQIVARDAKGLLHQMNVDLNPFATPVADSLAEEMRRNFRIGMNDGELAFNLLAPAGAGALKTAGVLGRVWKPSTFETFLAKGFSPEEAAYLARPYRGSRLKGHHFFPERWSRAINELSQKYFGQPIITDKMRKSDLIVLKPKGINYGDMFETHYKVDNLFNNTAYGPRNRWIWSGEKLGLEKYGLPGQIWHGAPPRLKEIAGAGIGTGWGVGSPSHAVESWAAPE